MTTLNSQILYHLHTQLLRLVSHKESHAAVVYVCITSYLYIWTTIEGTILLWQRSDVYIYTAVGMPYWLHKLCDVFQPSPLSAHAKPKSVCACLIPLLCRLQTRLVIWRSTVAMAASPEMTFLESMNTTNKVPTLHWVLYFITCTQSCFAFYVEGCWVDEQCWVSCS